MKPYYDDGRVTIYHGDCRDVLEGLGDVADILLTDPPYSSGGFQEAARSNGSLTGRHKARGESLSLDNLSTRGFERLMRETLRLCNQADEAYVFTDWRMWINTYDVVEAAGWRVRNMLVWDKCQMGMGLPWRNQHELVVFGKRTPATMLDGKHGNVLRVPRARNEHHPTEKPVELVRLLIANSSGRVVLDPFMGSGTTLRAAKDLGLEAIGIELDERYCEVAAQRLGQDCFDFGEAA